MINGIPMEEFIRTIRKELFLDYNKRNASEIPDEEAFRLIEEIVDEIEKIEKKKNITVSDEDAFKLIEEVMFGDNKENKSNVPDAGLAHKERKLIFKVVYPNK